MSQIEDVERYRKMKLPEWVSISNPASAGYDSVFVATIAAAFASGLLHAAGPYPLATGNSSGIFNGPSISGVDKVS